MRIPSRSGIIFSTLSLLALLLCFGCSNIEEVTGASTSPSDKSSATILVPASDQINNSPATWETSPPWDCKSTPPVGWTGQLLQDGSCVLFPTPSTCAPLTINGRGYCGPSTAQYEFGCGPESTIPCKTTVVLGESKVIWQTDAATMSTVVEWSVSDADSAAFSDLHRALYEDASKAPAPDTRGTPPVSPGTTIEAD